MANRGQRPVYGMTFPMRISSGVSGAGGISSANVEVSAAVAANKAAPAKKRLPIRRIARFRIRFTAESYVTNSMAWQAKLSVTQRYRSRVR